jgi:hypothetical protein
MPSCAGWPTAPPTTAMIWPTRPIRPWANIRTSPDQRRQPATVGWLAAQRRIAAFFASRGLSNHRPRCAGLLRNTDSRPATRVAELHPLELVDRARHEARRCNAAALRQRWIVSDWVGDESTRSSLLGGGVVRKVH